MKLFLFTLLISMVAFTACSETPEEAKTEKTEEIVVEDVPVYVKPEGEPDRVVVQHILIAFKGKVPRAKRSREEAQELAEALLSKANAGDNYDLLVKTNTDDQYPGKYAMVNFGVNPTNEKDIPRQGLVGAFGDVGFKLGIGEIGMAEFDEKNSPYGWHIIKRVE